MSSRTRPSATVVSITRAADQRPSAAIASHATPGSATNAAIGARGERRQHPGPCAIALSGHRYSHAAIASMTTPTTTIGPADRRREHRVASLQSFPGRDYGSISQTAGTRTGVMR